ARVTELETKLVKLKASEQIARERYDVVSSKLEELISQCKELRDSALASESNAESAEAAAILAERQASAFREERDAAREEVGTMRSVVLSLSEELEPVRQAARNETAEVRRRFKEQEAATDEAREALATTSAELEKARRELKQRGQLARNPPSAVDGVSSSSPDPASDSVVGAPPSLGAATMRTATDGTLQASLLDGREGRKRFQEGGDEKGPANQQQKKP
ncbi:unnamed protein product, partial [Ascophyllum nodosum]